MNHSKIKPVLSLSKYFGSYLNDNLSHFQISEIRHIPEVSVDNAHHIRQALNKSQLDNRRNHKLNSTVFSDSGSRNQFNLGSMEMWSKVSSKSYSIL